MTAIDTINVMQNHVIFSVKLNKELWNATTDFENISSRHTTLFTVQRLFEKWAPFGDDTDYLYATNETVLMETR